MSYKTKLISVALSVTTVALLSGAALPMIANAALTDAQVQSILQLLQSFGADQTTINNVNASLHGQATTSSSSNTSTACTFTRDLTTNAKGPDVTCLQNYLTSTGHFTYSGGATGFFGSITGAAVAQWQAANGITPAVGYFGAKSRAKYSALWASGPSPIPTPNPNPTPGPVAAAGTLTVAAGVQPQASLMPVNSVRVPFTVVNFTAGGADITVNSLLVERTGLAADTAITGVVLLDETGAQIGIAKTLNSLHQTLLNTPFVVKAGTTRMMTIAGNAETSVGSLAGQVPYLTLNAVNSTATSVSGILPITGVGQTINESLSIGSVTMQRGPLDPGAIATKKVGEVGYIFSSVKVTAGSAEQVYLKFIRWNQTGSVSNTDLTNLMTYVDGTPYPIVVSADGKYYTSVFTDNSGQGILIDKGFSKEIYVKGDLASGSGRTVILSIAKRTDLGLVGATFHYGITPPQTSSCTSDTTSVSCFRSVEDPWYQASTVTVSNGSITVSSDTTIPAQNIAINLNNQPLGGFQVVVKGEQVSVGKLIFHINTSGTGKPVNVTNITLVDPNGAVVAGPNDGANGGTGITPDGTVTFTSTVTFPIGTGTYVLKGKIGTTFVNNDTIAASTTPSTNWTVVTGLTTGNSITPSSAVVSGQTMTVKSGALTVSVSSVPIAQAVIAGSSQFLFANYILDGTASGEDVRLSNIPLAYNAASGSATDVTSCQLYDGVTVINTSSVSPTAAASSSSFTFTNNGLTIPKGTVKTISLKCDVISGATGSYVWGIDPTLANSTNWTGVTGLTSGQTITQTITSTGYTGQFMAGTSAGTLGVVQDSNAPSYAIVGAGQTGVVLNRLKYSATNENVDLRQVALILSNSATNTPIDLIGRQVSLYTSDGALVGTAVFPTGVNATSSAIASGSFRIPANGSKILVIKGDIAGISVSGPLTRSGDLLIVDYDGKNKTAPAGNYGVGVSSGSNANGAAGLNGSTGVASSGVRIMKAYPTLTAQSVPSTILPAGTTANQKLYRYSVTANNGDIALYKQRFLVGSSTLQATTSLFSLYAYTDAGYSNIDTGFSSTGLINGGQCYNKQAASSTVQGGQGGTMSVDIRPDKTGCNAATTTYIVPSGVTRYFELRGTVTGVSSVSTSKDSISVYLAGDAAYPVTGPGAGGLGVGTLGSGPIIDTDANNAFIWSPISTTTQNTWTDQDFTNSYQVVGLPSTGMTQIILQSQ